MPNTLATLAIYAWVPISLFIFRIFTPITATTVVLLGGLAILPAGFNIDFPGLPPIDRGTVAALGAFLGFTLVVPRSRKARYGFRWPEKLILVYSLCGFFTSAFNTDVLVYGNRIIPGLSIKDGVGVFFYGVVALGMPFYVGSRLVKNIEDLQEALKVVMVFGLFYIPIILWENRMSPQLHANLYGFFPHAFGQHIRGDGYRPVGFTSHGLELALFMVTSLLAAIGFGMARIELIKPGRWVPFHVLFVGVLLCKSFASICYAILMSLLMILGKRKTQTRIATLLVVVVVAYPILRSFDMIPTDAMVDYARKVSVDRAASLEFRFANEDALLEKARERIWFGWGSWGRHHVFDPITGQDLSVIDGYWIILLGKSGILGFAAFYALLLGPVYLAVKRIDSINPMSSRWLVLSMVFIVLIRAVDLIPNAFITPITMFFAGSLYPFTLNQKTSQPAPDW